MWGIPLFVFHDNAVLFEVSLWIYPHFPPDLHYFRRLQAGVTDFRTRHFAACRLRLKKKVREPVAVWKHMNTRTATSPIPKIWEKITFRPSITAYVVGDDCFDQRDRLIEALNKPGPARLSTRHMVS